ncbi:hypothetical protein AAVH_35885, partial [Aphelenchoides avenae]
MASAFLDVIKAYEPATLDLIKAYKAASDSNKREMRSGVWDFMKADDALNRTIVDRWKAGDALDRIKKEIIVKTLVKWTGASGISMTVSKVYNSFME